MDLQRQKSFLGLGDRHWAETIDDLLNDHPNITFEKAIAYWRDDHPDITFEENDKCWNHFKAIYEQQVKNIKDNMQIKPSQVKNIKDNMQIKPSQVKNIKD
eukprot:18203_1